MADHRVDKVPIEPISRSQKAEVVTVTEDCIKKAGQCYDRQFSRLPVLFDLKGKCAGMYQRRGDARRIRYNPWLFAKYYPQSLQQTIPHEVAHYIADCLWGIERIKPHGREWRSVMIALGAKPVATGNYSLEGIPVRQYQRYDYQCNCKVHQLTAIRHRRIQLGKASYRCHHCGALLSAVVQ